MRYGIMDAINSYKKSRPLAAYTRMMHLEVFNNIKPFLNRRF